MAGVGVISSLAVFLLLLLASFSAAREERPSKRPWGAVTTTDQEKYKYLVLLEYGSAPNLQYCSGSITSPSTVLTYCTGNATTAYAGLLTATDKNNPEVQTRKVTDVKVDTSDKQLKICVVDNWEWNKNVGAVKLNLKGESARVGESCEVLGFGGEGVVAQRMEQKIGSRDECKITAVNLVPNDNHLYSATTADELLRVGDEGGPVVCGKNGEQRAINVKTAKGNDNSTTPVAVDCNTFVNIAKYRKWIEDNTPQESGDQGPNGNGTVASTGSSIHGYMKKNSEWKVLGFITSAIVIFLQY